MHMSQTISDLWNGNIAPVEHCGAHDPELNNLLRLLERHREQLREGFTPAQKENFEKFIDCSDEYFLRMLGLAFCEGYILGGRLMLEVSN